MKAVRFSHYLFLVLVLSLFPQAAYGDNGSKVYFEDGCLKMFSQHAHPTIGDNETKIDESRLVIGFHKVVVSETRDGELNTYIQIKDCSVLQPAN